MYKSFIFDMDGVMINSEPLHLKVDQYILNKFGLEMAADDLKEFVGMTDPEMWGRIRDNYSLEIAVEEIINLQLQTKVTILHEYEEQLIEGIKELLDLLRFHNKKIGLASSSPRQYIEAVLNKYHIRNYFHCIISGEEVDKGKPSPDIYLTAAKLLDTEIGDCIVLEDSRNGVAAAKAAGMRCIGYQNIDSGYQDLTKADIIINTIVEIDEHLLDSI